MKTSIRVLGLLPLVGLGCSSGQEFAADESVAGEPVVPNSAASREDIGYAHERLAAKGYLPNAKLAARYPGWEPVVGISPVDPETFDRSSLVALKAFQRDYHLSPTGELDDQTLVALSDDFCGVPAASSSNSDKWALIRGAQFTQTNIFYKVLAHDDMTMEEVRAVIADAFATWQGVTNLTFNAVVQGPTTPTTITFGFVDSGPLGNAQGLKITFSRTENWTATKLQAVALHEIGHAIGIHHTGNLPSAVMGPTGDQVGGLTTTSLSDEDIVPANAMYSEWQRLPGTATDIGVGGPSQAWIIGSTPVSGGFNIFSWNESRFAFEEVSGGATRIAVGGGNVWVVNDAGNIFKRSGAGWTQVPIGCANDIGVSAAGVVWIIGCDSASGGYGIYKLTGSPFQPFESPWTRAPGSARRISVDALGRAWITNTDDAIYRGTGGAWERMPGLATDIGVGGVSSALGGTVFPWIIGASNVSGGRNIATFSEQTQVGAVDSGGSEVPGRREWFAVPGGATQVAVDASGRPWLVNSEGRIYRRRRD